MVEVNMETDDGVDVGVDIDAGVDVGVDNLYHIQSSTTYSTTIQWENPTPLTSSLGQRGVRCCCSCLPWEDTTDNQDIQKVQSIENTTAT